MLTGHFKQNDQQREPLKRCGTKKERSGIEIYLTQYLKMEALKGRYLSLTPINFWPFSNVLYSFLSQEMTATSIV